MWGKGLDFEWAYDGYSIHRGLYPDPIYAKSIKSYISNFKTWLNS